MSSKYISSVVGIDFQSTTFTGTEGESVSICFDITSGSVDLFGLVNVTFVTTDITATSVYSRNNHLNCTAFPFFHFYMHCAIPFTALTISHYLIMSAIHWVQLLSIY